MGYLPEIKIDGVTYAQTTPILNYLQKTGKMDKLTDEEQLRSGNQNRWSDICSD